MVTLSPFSLFYELKIIEIRKKDSKLTDAKYLIRVLVLTHH